jgi:hypothetical protein
LSGFSYVNNESARCSSAAALNCSAASRA